MLQLGFEFHASASACFGGPAWHLMHSGKSQSHIPDASLALVWSWEDEEEAVRAQKESVGQDSVGLRVG